MDPASGRLARTLRSHEGGWHMGSSTSTAFLPSCPSPRAHCCCLSDWKMCWHLWGRLVELRPAVTGTGGSWGGLKASTHTRITAKMLLLFPFYLLPIPLGLGRRGRGWGGWLTEFGSFKLCFSHIFLKFLASMTLTCWQEFAGKAKEWGVIKEILDSSWLSRPWLLAFLQIAISQ